MVQELTTASQKYLIELNEAINQFNSITGNYCNVIVTTKLLHSNLLSDPKESDKDKLDKTKKLMSEISEEEKNTILTVVQSARFYSIQTFIRVRALKDSIKDFQEKFDELKTQYDLIIITPVPLFETIQEYSFILNEMFAKVTGPELEKSSSDYYDKISSINSNQ